MPEAQDSTPVWGLRSWRGKGKGEKKKNIKTIFINFV
jgi:hypothetical protein